MRMANITFPHNKDLITLSKEDKYKHLIHDKEGSEANNPYIPKGMGIYILFVKENDDLLTSEEDKYKSETKRKGNVWNLYFDSTKSIFGAHTGITLYIPYIIVFTLTYRLNFECRNNTIEYEALDLGYQN